MGASDRRKLWICRFAWTTQTRCPHTHSSDRKKRRKRLEDSFEEEENRNGRRLYTLISTVPGPSDGFHLSPASADTGCGGARRLQLHHDGVTWNASNPERDTDALLRYQRIRRAWSWTDCGRGHVGLRPLVARSGRSRSTPHR